MASSSSSTRTRTRPWKYDVFLSFRGEDTRKTFVDHLYKALNDRLIRTYKDDITLPKDESVGPSLLKAIEESRIAVVIFSTNYADSSWCLDELVHIMKCRDQMEKIVIPIFYDVDPSDVRKQKRKFGEAFSKQQMENVTKAELWRKALVDASNISGWELKNLANGHEAGVIKEIVDAISDKLLSSNSDIDEKLVGMPDRVEDLISRLEIGTGGVRMVGIWGLGGSGKTTLATCVYMKIKDHFEVHCIVDNIREESSKHGLKTLQEKLLTTVLKTKVEVQSEYQGIHMIKSRLCRSNVLIVLDDVDDCKQLESLAGSHKWFGDGSRIIITTRDKYLLTTHKVDEIYPISLLSNDEAILLFNRHAYQEKNPIKDYGTLSHRVVSYAAGLPLALKDLGSFLYNKDQHEWMSTLDKLKDVPDHKIMEKLKISYDGLKTIEKELFLDIACFFRGKHMDEAKEILDACGFHPDIGIRVLIQKGLITINSDAEIDMHDLVQQMGHYIVRGEHPHNPEKHTRVWRPEEIEDMFSKEATKENDKIEALQYSAKEHSSAFFELISVLKNLRFLIVSIFENKHAKGPYFISNKLRYIYWKNYPASPFPESFQPTNLVVLKLNGTLQKELWKGEKYLPRLKVLHISNAHALLKTPDFDRLPSLTELTLYKCSSLQEIHPSLANLSMLVYISIRHCHNLISVPTIKRMYKLESLEIVHCDKLRKFPEVQAIMDRHELKIIEETDDPISHRSSSLLSSIPIPGSYTRWWNHDIFLSFRGDNACKTFVDQLYSALIQQGIHTYKPDETLSHGDLIGLSLLKAIEESRIAIIIFSKNYAGSSRCLDELAYIMKGIDKRDQNVMPIFYDVDASDVREQIGEFGIAFERMELENMTKAESWRNALMGACDHSGWSLNHFANMNEDKYIKDIVDTISHRLDSLISDVKKDLIGMGSRMEKFISTLAIGSGGVKMVGVLGMGGGGKTTLASSVYMETSRQFDNRCFVANIREESSKYGLKKLQQYILSTILKKDVEVPSDEEGRYMIKSMLSEKNVLIVLDDVDDLDQLEALAGSHDWFGRGSRIIVTTRDQSLLSGKVDMIYDVILLLHDEALQLICRHACGKYQLIEDYEMLSDAVVSRMGYISKLPLALKILGLFLFGRIENEWNRFLTKLADSSNPSLMDIFRIIYDELQPTVKELFLDITCFFRYQPKDEVMMILDACYLYSHIGVRALIRDGLISIIDGRFDMHDIVQEMGHYIIKGENKDNPEKHGRIWQEEDVLKICSMDTALLRDNKIQALHAFHHDAPPNLLKAVASMKNLKLLNVRQHAKEVAEEPLFLSDELRWICWVNYPASSLPTDFQPTNLVGLILENGLQKELWKDDEKLPSFKIPSLKFLRLRGSSNLIRTPDFSGLPNLENLVLSSCSSLKEIHPSIGHLKRLVNLNLDGCDKLEMFPPIVTMQKLETLVLSGCWQLRNFPEIRQIMDGLQHIYMDHSGIEVIPSSVGQYCVNLVSLSLIGCDNLQRIEGNFQLLQQRCLILFDGN